MILGDKTMMKEEQKRNKQVNVYLNDREQKLIESYLRSREDYISLSAIFRTVLVDKINEDKNKDKK